MALRVVGGGVGFLCLVFGGNIFYTRRVWKVEHPVVQQSLQFIQGDKKISHLLEEPINMKKWPGIQGILAPEKSFANITFKVQGANSNHFGTVSLLAERSSDSSGILDNPPPPLSFIERNFYKMGGYDVQKDEKDQFQKQGRWTIISLYVKLDDINTFPIIAENFKTHAQLLSDLKKQITESKNSQQVKEEDVEIFIDTDMQKPLPMVRREQLFANIRKRYIYLALGIFGSFIGFVFYKQLGFKIVPVGNSIFQEICLRRVLSDLQVQKTLGTPIKTLPGVKGNITSNLKRGWIEQIIYGPKAYGKLYATGKFEKDQWTFSEFKLIINEETINLIK